MPFSAPTVQVKARRSIPCVRSLTKQEGILTINGHDVCEERSLVRKVIGIVFQDSTLDTQMTVEENLKYHCSFYNVPKTRCGSASTLPLNRWSLRNGDGR